MQEPVAFYGSNYRIQTARRYGGQSSEGAAFVASVNPAGLEGSDTSTEDSELEDRMLVGTMSANNMDACDAESFQVDRPLKLVIHRLDVGESGFDHWVIKMGA